MRLPSEKVVITFEWGGVKRKNVIDSRVSDFKNQRVASCFEGVEERRIEKKIRISIIIFLNGVFESVHRTLKIVIVVRRGRKLRDFSRRGRGYRLRGRRKNVHINVTLRKPKRLEFLSLVDEMIGDSLR